MIKTTSFVVVVVNVANFELTYNLHGMVKMVHIVRKFYQIWRPFNQYISVDFTHIKYKILFTYLSSDRYTTAEPYSKNNSLS